MLPLPGKAMVEVNKPKPSRDSMDAFFQTVEHLNLKEVVGLCRYITSIRASCVKQGLPHALKAMDMVIRLGFQQNFPQQFSALTSWVDGGLCTLYASSKTQGMEKKAFLELHQAKLLLVLPAAAFREVQEPHKPWVECMESLQALVRSSAIGDRLFSTSFSQVCNIKASQKLQELLEELFQKDVVSMEAWALAKKAAVDSLTSMGDFSRLVGLSEVELKYQGHRLKVSVKNVQEHIDLAFQAYMKGVAVELGMLPRLPVEELLFGKELPKKNSNQSLPWELVSSAATARKSLMSLMLDCSDLCSGEAIMQFVAAKMPGLCLTDPFFAVEVGIFNQLRGALLHVLVGPSLSFVFPNQKVGGQLDGQ